MFSLATVQYIQTRVKHEVIFPSSPGGGTSLTSKRGPDRSSTAKKLSFDVKIAKIGPADLQIICLREIIKKDKKERNYGR